MSRQISGGSHFGRSISQRVYPPEAGRCMASPGRSPTPVPEFGGLVGDAKNVWKCVILSTSMEFPTVYGSSRWPATSIGLSLDSAIRCQCLKPRRRRPQATLQGRGPGTCYLGLETVSLGRGGVAVLSSKGAEAKSGSVCQLDVWSMFLPSLQGNMLANAVLVWLGLKPRKRLTPKSSILGLPRA